MIFTYLLIGWEGFTYNAIVLRDAEIFNGFITLFKKYYLRNARYFNKDHLLILYYGIKYYFKKQKLANEKP